MLYDPKWSVTKADPFAIESLVAWLEQQPADKEYCYLSNGQCLLAQYFSAAGFENVHMFANGFWHGAERCPIHVGWDQARERGMPALPRGFNEIANGAGKTFGDALGRARRTHG